MLKNILKLDGAQQLSKNEQKEISGGTPNYCREVLSNGCEAMSSLSCDSPREYDRICKCCN